jgi:hypothetical protein
MHTTNASAPPPHPPIKLNPDYHADWKQLHGDANARREAAWAVKARLMSHLSDLTDTDRADLAKAEVEWEAAHQLCMLCLDTYQHRTFEEAMTWLNQTFCSTAPVSVPDLHAFSDVRQLIKAAYRIHSRRLEMKSIERNMLDLSHTDSFSPFFTFADCSTWEVTIPSHHYRTASDIHAHYTIDEADDGMHVAMQTARRSIGAINASEMLIEEFLRQRVSQWMERRWFFAKKLPPITFYTYSPPSEFIKESFNRVELRAPLNRSKPISVAEWSSVGCVPAAVRPNWLHGGLADWGTFDDDANT